MPECSLWRHTIQTPFTTAACWRTNKAEPMKPSTSSGRASRSARIRRTGIAISGLFCKAAASALRPSGLLVFTLEHAVGEDNIDYRLELHGRYSHSLPYVKRVLIQSGLTAEAESAELRNEAGTPVAGLVVRAAK